MEEIRIEKKAVQARDFGEVGSAALNRAATTMAVSSLSAQEARQKVPGLGAEALLAEAENSALLIQGGLVLDSHRYLRCTTPPSLPLLSLISHLSHPKLEPISWSTM